jgi:hypothetical protein
MKFIIEIEVPELDHLMTQDKQLEAIDAQFRRLLQAKEGGNGLVITEVMGLIEQAKLLTVNGLPTPPPYQQWLREIALYHFQSFALREHGRLQDEVKKLGKQFEKYYVSPSQNGYESSLRNIEKVVGAATTQKINREIQTLVNNQLKGIEDATEETAIEAYS